MRAALSNIALLAALSQGAHAVIGIPLEWDESVEKMTDSADTFCFFVWCVTGPEGQTVYVDQPNTLLSISTNNVTRTYDAATEHQSMNRQDIGQKSVLFNDGGKEKYGTERQSDDHTWGDEYPFASSLEGGEDLAGHPTAVLRGATQPDQSLQGNWIKNVLWKTGENAGQMKNTPVTITIKNPNTDLR